MGILISFNVLLYTAILVTEIIYCDSQLFIGHPINITILSISINPPIRKQFQLIPNFLKINDAR